MNHIAAAGALQLQLQLQQCRYCYYTALRLYLALTKLGLTITDYSKLLYNTAPYYRALRRYNYK